MRHSMQRIRAVCVITASSVACVLPLVAADPLDRANELFGGGDFAAAAEAFDEATVADPANAEAWFGLARSHAALDQGARAIAALRRLAETGSTARLRVANTPEFAALAGQQAFDQVLAALRPCRGPEYRQFDFWLGDWDVTSSGGRKSHNRISSIQDGCIVLEEYDTPSGYTGTSLSYHDAGAEEWVQVWMDNQGQPIVHRGGLVDGAMVLTDDADESGAINRTTWTPLSAGRVRQHWQRSTDGGQTWSTVFDGTYVRRP